LEELKIKQYFGNYRGTVVANVDPKVKGRCKIYVPGIYPEELAKIPENLPWAEPAMDIFGGSWINENQTQTGVRTDHLNIETGVTSNPHAGKIELTGAQFWVFFEGGDPQFPIYFAACQSGEGWISEHNNQHCINTDNVRVRIDERPEDPKSTCKFNTYNSKCVNPSTSVQKIQERTRVDIEIWNQEHQAVHLHIKGDVNMHIEGNYYEEIFGDRHITHIGDTYYKHVGDTLNVTEGDIYDIINGDETVETVGEKATYRQGNEKHMYNGNYYSCIHGIEDLTVINGSYQNYHGEGVITTAQNILSTSYSDISFQAEKDFNTTSKRDTNLLVLAEMNTTVTDDNNLTINGAFNTDVTDVINTTCKSTIDINATDTITTTSLAAIVFSSTTDTNIIAQGDVSYTAMGEFNLSTMKNFNISSVKSMVVRSTDTLDLISTKDLNLNSKERITTESTKDTNMVSKMKFTTDSTQDTNMVSKMKFTTDSIQDTNITASPGKVNVSGTTINLN